MSSTLMSTVKSVFIAFGVTLALSLSAFENQNCDCNPPPATPRKYRRVELLDIALYNSPLTESAWFQAKAAAAVIGQEESNYAPNFNIELSNIRAGSTGFLGSGKFNETNINLILSLTYLLWDFGNRDNLVKSAVASFKAANWTYSWTIQTVLLNVLLNYYSYLTAEALYEAQLQNLRDAKLNESVAIARHEAGVNTITDVLQAKANRVNVELNVANQYASIRINHANLANAMGIRPDSCFDVEGLPHDFQVEPICADIEKMLKLTNCARADLAAQRATVQAFKYAYCAQISALWPTLSATGNFQRTTVHDGDPNELSYNAGLIFNIPVFSGFSQIEIIRQAKAELMSSKAQLRTQELQAFTDVMTAYYNVKAAAFNLTYSAEFLKFATEAYEATLAGYRVGTQSMIDVLASQVILANARATRATSKTGWFTALVQLAYSIGCLRFTPDGTLPPQSSQGCNSWR